MYTNLEREIPKDKIREFLVELTLLTRKYGIEITSADNGIAHYSTPVVTLELVSDPEHQCYAYDDDSLNFAPWGSLSGRMSAAWGNWFYSKPPATAIIGDPEETP